jgi:hypothetical protein
LLPVYSMSRLLSRTTSSCTSSYTSKSGPRCYHLLYRATWVDRSLSVRESLRTLASWLNSPQALLLMLLAAVALTVPPNPGERDEQRRRELRLCGWLVAGLALFLAIPLPTFPQYFILVVPFLSILAALGMNLLGARLWPSVRPSLRSNSAEHSSLPSGVALKMWLVKCIGSPRARDSFTLPKWSCSQPDDSLPCA